MTTPSHSRGLAVHASVLTLLSVMVAACSRGEKAPDSSAAAGGNAAVRALAAPAGRETCPGRSPTRAFTGAFSAAQAAAQRAYLGQLAFEPSRPSADSIRLASQPGSADSVSLRFEPESCSNFVNRSRHLKSGGRVVARIVVAGEGRYPALGIRSAADTVFWFVGPAGADTTVRSYFVRVGDTTTYSNRYLVLGAQAPLAAPQSYAEVRFFHDSAHVERIRRPGDTGGAGATLMRERRVGANLWQRELALQIRDVDPWFACDVDCCISSDTPQGR